VKTVSCCPLEETMYLSKEVLSGFDKYKYNSIDNSPVSNYITHPFWNWVVQFYPTWLAPNAITLAGFMFLVLQFVVFTYYDADFYASSDNHPDYPPIPNWVWLFSGLCIFLAHTLDGTDGKQARRTKTSGPLGELFDHGLDSWATLFMPIGLFSVYGRGDYSVDAFRMSLVMVSVQVTFIMSHWEKYNTGILFLPWGYDPSQIAMVVMYLITWYSGYTVWKFYVPYTGMTCAEVFELIMYGGVIVLQLPMTLWNIYWSYAKKSGKMYSFYEAQRPLIPSLVLFVTFYMWAYISPYSILQKEPRLFMFAMGTAFANSTSRLIVSGMSNTRCDAFNVMLVPLMAIVLGTATLKLGVMEAYLLLAYTIYVLVAHLHYGVCVVKQLADHFNIYVFSVEKPPSK